MERQYSFHTLYIDGTRRCNLNCHFCMAGSNDSRVVRQSVRQELTYDEIVRRVLIPAKDLGICHVQYGGGEFLLRPDAIDLIRATVDMGYEVRLLTNGVLVTAELLETLREVAGRRLVLVFGINSVHDGQVNLETRKMDVDLVLRAIQTCRDHRIRKHVVINVGRHNMKSLDATCQWLSDRKISFNRAPFVGRGSGKKYFSRLGFTREDMRRYIYPALVKHVAAYLSFTPFFLSPEVHAEISGGRSWNGTVPQDPHIGCWIGSWIAVGAEGDVSPCSTLLDELIAGNVRQTSLYDIIDKSDIFQNLLNRDAMGGKCGRCRYRRTCGGCRAMAHYRTGDYMAEDPTCFFDPEDERTRSEWEELTNSVFRKYARVARYVGITRRTTNGSGIGRKSEGEGAR